MSEKFQIISMKISRFWHITLTAVCLWTAISTRSRTNV